MMVRGSRSTLSAMSELPPSGFDWLRARKFSVAPTGYWSLEVERLLDDLERADTRGEPLAPIMDARHLSEVGFGYNMAEVNAVLDILRGRGITVVSPSPKMGVTPLPARRELLYPPRSETGEPLSSETVAVLSAIKCAKYLPVPLKFERGYDKGEVDRFFAGLYFAAGGGQPILPAVQKERFTLTGKEQQAYDVAAVDELLDRVSTLASEHDGVARVRVRERVPRLVINFGWVVAALGAVVVVAAFAAKLAGL